MMKSNKQSLFGIALLASAAAFTACSSDEAIIDEAVTQPEETPYGGETVKTKFAINIPYGASKRMTVDNTQGDNDLHGNGLKNIHLLMHNEEFGDNTAFARHTPLAAISTFNSGVNQVETYNDVNVPVGTTHFVFYGLADCKASGTHTDFTDGALATPFDNNTVPTNTADMKFSLKGISLDNTDFTTVQNAFATYLTQIATVEYWSNITDNSNPLQTLYTDFTKLKAGSANAILNTLTDLYNIVKPLSESSSNETVKTIASNIAKAIVPETPPTNGIIITASETGGIYTLNYGSTENKYKDFPAHYNIPEGAVALQYTSNAFSYVQTEGVIGTNENHIKLKSLCYPSSLNYFTSTELWASNSADVTWPTTANWETSTNFLGWGTTVLSSTQSVALKNNIQYSVANLKLGVQCKTATLADNSKTGDAETPIMVTVPAEGIKVTGLLIGGQPTFVDWKFAPVTGATDNSTFDRTVYDNDVNIFAKTTVPTDFNYTLLLANTGDVNESQASKVNFVIECENNTGTEFMGHDGKIAKNAKFYLLGTLDPNATENVTNPNGVTNPSVFMQDYQTTANITISSLKNAYEVIPDLRANKFQLGLSVDLTWQAGIIFKVDIK